MVQPHQLPRSKYPIPTVYVQLLHLCCPISHKLSNFGFNANCPNCPPSVTQYENLNLPFIPRLPYINMPTLNFTTGSRQLDVNCSNLTVTSEMSNLHCPISTAQTQLAMSTAQPQLLNITFSISATLYQLTHVIYSTTAAT